MFFVLSKTLNYLTMPLSLICLCFLVSVLLRNKRWKKIFFWAGFVTLFFFSNGFISNAVMHAWEIKATPYSEMKKHKLGIVLTGATRPLPTPNDRVYFGRGADRVTHTVQLYKLGLIEKILISGGSGRLVDIGEKESLEFRDAMLLMGVSPADILTESETRNTHESAVKVKEMIRALGYKSKDCLLITSAFHMRRSLACYQKAGLAVDHFTTDFYSSPSFRWEGLFIPNVEALDTWTKVIREWVGFVAYKLAGYI